MSSFSGITPAPENKPGSNAVQGLDLSRLDPSSNAFIDRLSAILVELGRKNTDSLTPGTLAFLIEKGLIEAAITPSRGNSMPGLPYFLSDAGTHAKIFETHQECEELSRRINEVDHTGSEIYFIDQGAAEPVSLSDQLHTKWVYLLTLKSELEGLHKEKNIQFGSSFVRLTSSAERSVNCLDKLSPAGQEIYSKLLAASIRNWNREALPHIVRHLEKLCGLPNPERHLRKFSYNFVNKSFAPLPAVLERAYILAYTDVQVDQYLKESAEGYHGPAEKWLQSANGANYCPPPYVRASEQERVYEESRKIVVRAKNHSYSFDRFAAETRRGPDGSISLFSRFIQENFEISKAAYAGSNNIPPGKGFFFSGPIMERLFSPVGGSLEKGIEIFKEVNSDWLGQAVDYFPFTNFLALRGAWGVINYADDFLIDVTKSFEVDAEGRPVQSLKKYSYLALNDHMTEEYAPVYLYPSAILAAKLKDSLFDIPGPLPESLCDICDSGLEASGLFKAAAREDLPVLNLAWCSTLFAGGAYSYPAMYGKYLKWEAREQHVAWRDINHHIHPSYRIWSLKENFEACQEKLRPLQKLHENVAQASNKYQSLLELLFNRYGAWKNGQTPNRAAVPLMLTETYRRHGWAEHASYEDMDILCLIDRANYSAAPIPLLDTIDLRLLNEQRTIRLPRGSDGTGRTELDIWQRYITPYLYADGNQTTEGRYNLAFIRREYVR